MPQHLACYRSQLHKSVVGRETLERFEKVINKSLSSFCRHTAITENSKILGSICQRLSAAAPRINAGIPFGPVLS